MWLNVAYWYLRYSQCFSMTSSWYHVGNAWHTALCLASASSINIGANVANNLYSDEARPHAENISGDSYDPYWWLELANHGVDKYNSPITAWFKITHYAISAIISLMAADELVNGSLIAVCWPILTAVPITYHHNQFDMHHIWHWNLDACIRWTRVLYGCTLSRVYPSV